MGSHVVEVVDLEANTVELDAVLVRVALARDGEGRRITARLAVLGKGLSKNRGLAHAGRRKSHGISSRLEPRVHVPAFFHSP